jgi:hypothetical protein
MRLRASLGQRDGELVAFDRGRCLHLARRQKQRDRDNGCDAEIKERKTRPRHDP